MSAPEPPTPADPALPWLRSHPRLGPEWIFALALALRLATTYLFDAPSQAQGARAWEWGWEAGALADSLVRGGGFADPFGAGTGPSGWLTPPYPWLVAGLMKLFGGVSAATAAALLGLQALASAATCALLLPLGARLGAPRVGRIAGWLLALHPTAVWYASALVWDTSFMGLGLVAFLLLLLREGPCPAPRRAAGVGAAFGALLLLNPTPIGILPAVLLYMGAGPRRALAARWGAFGAAALALLAPWMARNARVLGTPALRTNLGVELLVGNNDQADGRPQMRYHPADPRNTPRYQELGEVAFAREARDRALAWIGANPTRFARLCLDRVGFFWLGQDPRRDSRTSDGHSGAQDPLAWAKWIVTLATTFGALVGLLVWRPRRRGAALVLGVLLLFPLPYYATHVAERYRTPIDPLVVLLAAGVVARRRQGEVGGASGSSPLGASPSVDGSLDVPVDRVPTDRPRKRSTATSTTPAARKASSGSRGKR